MPRTALITGSVFVHLGLVAGAFIANAWDLERLTADRRSLSAVSVLSIPAAAGGGLPDRPSQALDKKAPKKRKVAELVQPTPPADPVAASAPAASAETTGDGAATGTSDGPTGGGDDPGCADCEAGGPPGGGGEPAGPPAVVSVVKPRAIAPHVLQGLRVAGDSQIHPDRVTQSEMIARDHRRVTGVVKLCIGPAGEITSATVVGSTRFPAYDERLTAAVRGWRYRPYLLGDSAIPVCGMVTFIYSIR